MNKVVPFFNGCVSFVAFITILALVIYMLIAFVTGTFDVALTMFDTLFLSPAERQSILNTVNSDFLHNVAVLLILMKAYRILIEYMRFHHIDIKFMVEIGIIASVLELLFNSTNYSEHMQMVLAALAVSFLGFYVFRYDNLLKAMQESQAAMCEAMNKKIVAEPAPETTVAKKTTRKTTAKKTTRKTAAK